MSYEIQSAHINVVIAKAKDNRHKKAGEPHRVKLKANAKTITVFLSCKRRGTSQAPVIVKATVETDNLLVARIEAAKYARSLGFADDDLIELDHKKHRC